MINILQVALVYNPAEPRKRAPSFDMIKRLAEDPSIQTWRWWGIWYCETEFALVKQASDAFAVPSFKDDKPYKFDGIWDNDTKSKWPARPEVKS